MVEKTNQTPLKEAYNGILFRKRNEIGMNRRDFAAYLHLRYGHYCLLENGYIKPSKQDVELISSHLGVDYKNYLEGESSYPVELPEHEQNALVRFFYRALGALPTKIIFIFFAVVLSLGFIGGLIAEGQIEKANRYFYGDTLVSFHESLLENGEPNISVVGQLSYPQISSTEKDSVNGEEKFVQIASNYNSTALAFTCSEIHWDDEYRLSFQYLSYASDGTHSFSCRVLDYSTSDSYAGSVYTKADHSKVVSMSEVVPTAVVSAVESYVSMTDFNADFSDLIEEKLSMDLDFFTDIASPLAEGEANQRLAMICCTLGYVACLVFGASFIFVSIYAFIYGQNKRKPLPAFGHGEELFFGDVERKPFKNDIRFTPFLPETVLELVGIAMVAIGSMRVILFGLSAITYSSENISLANGEFLSLLMLGMFLLYFLDFDLFMDDKRVLRNIAMYPLMFLVLYFLEATILTMVKESGTVLAEVVNAFLIPNPFGSAACYFAIMGFLFFTPKGIKSKRGLIIYRSLAILPIAYIVVSWLVFHGDTLFGWDMSNLYLKYFFDCERLPFSILAVSYLVGLYFLRLFFKKKYGEEGAQRFFMSNKFIMLKNILTCLLVIGVWVMEVLLANNATLNKMGIGINLSLILLVPLVLFYHPHKGPRNLAVDWTTMGLYGLSMGYAYVIAGILLALSLFTAFM